MRVLHLPLNIASQISITVRALRDIGVDAHGILSSGALVQDSQGVRNFGTAPRKSPKWWLDKARYVATVLWAIQRYDVIHWYFGVTLPGALDLKWAQRLGRPGIVEFWGSDIRVPEEEFKVNPYYAAAWEAGYEYRQTESRSGSYARQEKFVKHGITACLASDTFGHYLKPGLWSRVYSTRGRVLTAEFKPQYPSPDNPRPILAHSPTVKIGKGTAAVERAVEQLRPKYDFEYRLIHGMTYADAQQVKQTCDIFLDQFVDGSGYGLSAIEALAMGKPVLVYIRPSAVPLMPAGCPVINANQDDLAEVLEPYLRNGQLRHEVGRRGREFVENYHDAHAYAKWLVTVYQELIDQKRHHA
jgi:hypothetical protein